MKRSHSLYQPLAGKYRLVPRRLSCSLRRTGSVKSSRQVEACFLWHITSCQPANKVPRLTTGESNYNQVFGTIIPTQEEESRYKKINVIEVSVKLPDGLDSQKASLCVTKSDFRIGK